jgi:hypothetical protein
VRLNVVLVDNLEEDVHDLTLDVGADGHEFSVDSVEDCLQIIALTGVFAVEKLQETVNKVVRDVLRDHIMAKVGSQNKFEEEFVDKLEMWPCFLKMWLVLIRVHG